MQDMNAEIWQKIIEEVRFYPSPHNSQPIKVSEVQNNQADIFYDLDLGLPAESYGIPFAHVCGGVFLESLRIVSAKFGYQFDETIYGEELDFTSEKRLHRFATIVFSAQPVDQENEAEFAAFKTRQTSRLPYNNQPVPRTIIEAAQAIARGMGYTFSTVDDTKVVGEVVAINQATLFDDLRNDDVYNEIMLWLRFSRKEARQKSDGLSAETMLIPGALLHFFMKNRQLWSVPLIGNVARYMYMRTMKGVRQLGWIEGPFRMPTDYLEAGKTFMRLWIHFTRNGVCLHPFGTVITNPRSHKKFVEKVQIDESSQSMAWMLFRFGYSQAPPVAFRRPASVMIVDKERNGQDK